MEYENKIILLSGIFISIAILSCSLFVDYSYLDLDQVDNTVFKVKTNGSDVVSIEWSDKDDFTGDLFFGEELSLDANLSISTIEDSYNFTYNNVVVPFAAGQFIYLANNKTGRVFGGRVLNVVGNVVVMDTPLNSIYYPNSTLIIQQNIEMNVDGSTTPRIFSIANPTGIPITLDITRVLFHIECDNTPEFSKFGDIVGGLTRGIVLRTANGIKSNLFNVKTNGELAALMYDVTFYDQANPQGSYGIGGRITYAGPEKHGAVIRLEPGERLDLLVQDNLATLTRFRMMASFHLVS